MMRAAGGLLFLKLALGQTAAPAFDAASVKPTDANDHGTRRISPGRFTLTATPLRGFITRAYGLRGEQIVGGPAWIESDLWSIAAEAEGQPGEAQMNLMLRTLLEDRFKLKVRRETREVNLYALRVAKGGPKLKESSDGDGERYLRIYPPKDNLSTMDGHRAPIAYLVDRLWSLLRRPVMDQTGLKGEYDLKIEWADDDHREAGPDLLGAVQTLGLKLEPGKGPLEVLVVERAEKPGAN